jgi:hypothetical protein
MTPAEKLLRSAMEDTIQFLGILESTYREAKDASGLADIIAKYRERAENVLSQANHLSETKEPA